MIGKVIEDYGKNPNLNKSDCDWFNVLGLLPGSVKETLK